MKITLKERLYILQAIPPEGTYKEVLLARQLADKVKITDEEEEKYGVKAGQNGITNDKSADSLMFDFEFTEEEKELLKAVFSNLDKTASLNIGNVRLFDLFVNDSTDTEKSE